MNALLGMFLDGDVHARLEWELAIFAVCGGALMAALGWIILDVINRGRTTRKTVRRSVAKLAQHDSEIVEKLRHGKPFPRLSLSELEESGQSNEDDL